MENVTYTDHHKTGSNRKPVIEIPPRKLLSPVNSSKQNWNLASASKSEGEEESGEKSYSYDSDSDDPYASDHFRMFEFKIRRCNRSRSHDWTDCPFAHPGEKARRRDPRRFQYSGEVCPEFRRSGDCTRGDDCEFAHGVFECWLHPIRYRTEACKDGKHCKRKVCFFAHSPRQLRVLPPENNAGGVSDGGCNSGKQRCCLFCNSSSPTSTLLGNLNLSHLSRSPSVSPPMSPANRAAAFSRLRNRAAVTGSVNYKDVLSELVNSLDSISLAEALQVNCSSPVTVTTPMSTTAGNHRSSPLQFALSPSTPNYLSTMSPTSMTSFFSEDFTPRQRKPSDFTAVSTAVTAGSEKVGFECDPDLGWVNDLLT